MEWAREPKFRKYKPNLLLMAQVSLKLWSVALSAENGGNNGSLRADMHRTQVMPGKAMAMTEADGKNLKSFSVLIPDMPRLSGTVEESSLPAKLRWAAVFI